MNKEYIHIQNKISDSIFNINIYSTPFQTHHKVKIGNTNFSLKKSLIKVSRFSIINDTSTFVSDIIFKRCIPKGYLHR